VQVPFQTHVGITDGKELENTKIGWLIVKLYLYRAG